MSVCLSIHLSIWLWVCLCVLGPRYWCPGDCRNARLPHVCTLCSVQWNNWRRTLRHTAWNGRQQRSNHLPALPGHLSSSALCPLFTACYWINCCDFTTWDCTLCNCVAGLGNTRTNAFSLLLADTCFAMYQICLNLFKFILYTVNLFVKICLSFLLLLLNFGCRFSVAVTHWTRSL